MNNLARFGSYFVLEGTGIVLYIGVGRFRILGGGGARFRILGGGRQGWPNSQQAHDVVTTSCAL